MTHTDSSIPDAPSRWSAEVGSERAGWTELAALVRSLIPAECLVPGYYNDPAWTVRDVVAHIGTWLAQAEVQLERLRAGTYEGHDIDVDAINAQMLEQMRDQPWEVAWTQANSARTMMLQDWYRLATRDAESAWWVNKSGGEHYAEHLPRLREWTAELVSRRR
jgi:hypothetical protein